MGRKSCGQNESERSEVYEDNFISWIKKHKKGILIGTGIVVFAPIVIVGAVAVARAMDRNTNSPEVTVPDACDDFSDQYENIVDFSDLINRGTTKAPHEVNGFVRNMHEGWNASPEKIAEAAEMGIVLEKNQTYVDSYRTGTRD